MENLFHTLHFYTILRHAECVQAADFTSFTPFVRQINFYTCILERNLQFGNAETLDYSERAIPDFATQAKTIGANLRPMQDELAKHGEYIAFAQATREDILKHKFRDAWTHALSFLPRLLSVQIRSLAYDCERSTYTLQKWTRGLIKRYVPGLAVYPILGLSTRQHDGMALDNRFLLDEIACALLENAIQPIELLLSCEVAVGLNYNLQSSGFNFSHLENVRLSTKGIDVSVPPVSDGRAEYFEYPYEHWISDILKPSQSALKVLCFDNHPSSTRKDLVWCLKEYTNMPNLQNLTFRHLVIHGPSFSPFLKDFPGLVKMELHNVEIWGGRDLRRPDDWEWIDFFKSIHDYHTQIEIVGRELQLWGKRSRFDIEDVPFLREYLNNGEVTNDEMLKYWFEMIEI